MVRSQLLSDGAVFGNYRVVRRIGRGGAGEVYLVRHATLDSDYALKVLKPEVAEENLEFVERFIREGQIAAKVRHPNLIAVHDAGREAQSGLYYIVMDYVSGGSLRELLRQRGRIPAARALDIVRQIAAALDEGSKHGLVHRDIKPENIMFRASGQAVLADLGIAKMDEAGFCGVTMEKTAFGTPAYMSPEQARDVSKVDGRSDLFSLGIILYEMIAGSRPYANTVPTELLMRLTDANPVPPLQPGQASDSVRTLVSGLCEKEADRRVPSAAELIVRLDTCLTELQARKAEEDLPTVVAVPAEESPVKRGGGWPLRRILYAVAILLASVTLILLLVLWLGRSGAKPAVMHVEFPVAEPVAEPVVEPVVEPVAEPAAEPAVKPVAKPVAEPAVKPVAKPVAEPVAKPVAEPVVEPAVKPVAKSVAEPVAKPVEQSGVKRKEQSEAERLRQELKRKAELEKVRNLYE